MIKLYRNNLLHTYLQFTKFKKVIPTSHILLIVWRMNYVGTWWKTAAVEEVGIQLTQPRLPFHLFE